MSEKLSTLNGEKLECSSKDFKPKESFPIMKSFDATKPAFVFYIGTQGLTTGCKLTKSVVITVVGLPEDFFNAFSPNGDGLKQMKKFIKL